VSWLTLLLLVAVLVAVAAITGVKPRGGRPVARTRLMSAARVVLLVIAVLLAIAYFTGR
jgi:hypothetical protein